MNYSTVARRASPRHSTDNEWALNRKSALVNGHAFKSIFIIFPFRLLFLHFFTFVGLLTFYFIIVLIIVIIVIIIVRAFNDIVFFDTSALPSHWDTAPSCYGVVVCVGVS